MTTIATALLFAAAASAEIVERTTGPDASWANPVNRNLLRLARCETGYLTGGRVNWRHHNGTYTGGLGFAHSTWSYYKRFVRPVPRARYAADATVAQQLAVGRVLVRVFGGYSSWPACHRRLGLPG